MIFRSLLLAVALLMGSLAHAQLDRSKAPQPGPAPKINIGKYETFTLKNGLKVFVVENHKLPTMSIQLMLDLGPMDEGDATGYIDMAGSLMGKGSKKYTKDQINESVDFIGASFSTNSGGFYASCLSKYATNLLDIASDVVLYPTFPAEELEKMKLEVKSGLASAKTDPNAIADNVQKALVYGNHPYGAVMTEAALEKITLEKIKAYHSTYFKPNQGYLLFIGDITLAQAKIWANQYFGLWKKGKVSQTTYPAPQAPEKSFVALVDKPGAVQSVINISYPVDLKPGTEDQIKATVMNSILGGGVFSGRLMQNIREDKGYTYGAGSSLSADRYVGSFSASATVRNAVTDSATHEFLYEMKRMRDELVTEEELTITKNYMTGSFARSLENPQTIARFALNTALYKLPADYYQTYLQKLNAVTPADVQAIAKKYVRPDNAYIQIVGNLAEVSKTMDRFGKVQEYDIYGKPVKALEASAADLKTAEEVIERYIAVRGGRAKLEAVKNIYTTMEASLPMGTITAVLVEDGDRKAVIQKFGGQLVGKQLFFSDKVVTAGPMGSQELTGEKATQFKGANLLNPELQYAKHGFKLEMLGIKTVDGKAVYQVQLTEPSGNKVVQSYDKATGLLIKVDSPTAGTQVFDDYKAVDGILFPHKMRVNMQGMDIDFIMKEIKVNGEIDKSIFGQ